jgi:hypothetical protein
MVIFFNMIVKRKILTVLILALFLFPLLGVNKVYAQEPMFTFHPSSGVIKDVDEGFTVDILIDSGTEDLTKARMVFNFDPRQIQVIKASRNNSLFEQWPEDESTLDNENGVVMLTGFTQSGSAELYQTQGEQDLFARIEFEVVTNDSEAEIPLEWEFTGSDELFQTVLLSEGSPPQNILETRPQTAVFTIGELTQTAINPTHLTFVIGGLLILIAGVLITSKPELTRKKYGTVVVYDE